MLPVSQEARDLVTLTTEECKTGLLVDIITYNREGVTVLGRGEIERVTIGRLTVSIMVRLDDGELQSTIPAQLRLTPVQQPLNHKAITASHKRLICNNSLPGLN